MRKAIILVAALLFLIPSSFAIINTTFGSQSNPSIIISAYNATGGRFIDGTQANSFVDGNNWFNFSSAGNTAIYKSDHEFNITILVANQPSERYKHKWFNRLY
ncbi:hypothetical protein HYY70_01275 [Candidatus Woesearchaeota archaeon]|nr:hypothetical protein [Candidatus Woesearchaeota archaeon]